eukprot:662993_1
MFVRRFGNHSGSLIISRNMSTIADFTSTGRKVICVGRNYMDHVKELKNEIPKSPLLFFKSTSSYIRSGGTVLIPPGSTNVHFEVELGVVIGEEIKDCPPDKVMDSVAGYACAIDITARDIQEVAKSKGHPWSIAKAQDTFLPVSSFVPKEKIADSGNVGLWLKVDDQLKQDGNTSDMIWPVPKLLSYISTMFTLQRGDLVLTGTPAGVGPVTAGQCMTAGLHDISGSEIKVSVAQKDRLGFDWNE